MRRHPFARANEIFSRIKFQIAAYYLLASLLLAGVLGVALYYSIAGVFQEKTMQYTGIAIERSGRYLELYIDKMKSVSNMIATNPSTMRYMANEELLPGADRADLAALIDEALASDPFLTSIIAVSKDGRIVSNEETLDMTVSKDMMDQDWYVAAVEGNNMPVLTSARMQEFSMDRESWVVSVSREITDIEGNNIGVLRCDIDYSVVEDLLMDLDLGSEGYPFILNDDNEIVFYSDPGARGSDLLARLPAGTVPKGLTPWHAYDRETNLMTYSYRLENADWTLVGVASLDSLTVLQRQLMETLLLLSLVLVAVALGSGVVIAGRITKPIRKLEETMASVGEDIEAAADSKAGSYEIRSLASHFNDMMVKIRELMKEVEEKEKYLRTSEITALHNQINPHFLYNTLDTIVWMAEFGDSEKVIDITKSLASFFRLSLSKGEAMVTVEDEVAHVNQYLFIQKQRYQEKLSYTIDVDEEIRQYKVPKIILQPIVENALYHGIREKAGPGHIEVSGHAADCGIEFVIEDDGVGIDGSTIMKADMWTTGGIGMENVDKRIKLHFGEGYGLHVEGLEPGTRVVLKLGLNTGNERGDGHGRHEETI